MGTPGPWRDWVSYVQKIGSAAGPGARGGAFHQLPV
jgi:hypothetical protein